ncbi:MULTISPECIES: mevalonate kinase [unclassified Streptococcus]|uniref:mevalonate kinase n=1 Tax=unclassified Streptococcus TaxID=2608887 RepID=UPI00359E2835
MKKTVGVGLAHSKIIMMGEHAVVYGYPALALPLPRVTAICQVTACNLPVVIDPLDPIDTALSVALTVLDIAEPRIAYAVNSAIPEQRGMGSSAAVAIAVIRAVFDYYNQPLSDELLEDLVNKAEQVAHGNPSGLDAKTCLSDMPICYQRGQGFSPCPVRLKAHLIIADTGVYGNTSQAVQWIAKQGETALPMLSDLGGLAQSFLERLPEGHLPSLGELMTQAHRKLAALGVSCPEADQLVEATLSAGAFGAKMSGGGLGGCVIALTDTDEAAQAIAQNLREKGAVNTWIENL